MLVLFQPGGVLGFALFYLPYLLLYGRFALLVLFFLLFTLLLALARWALLNAGEALLVITAATQWLHVAFKVVTGVFSCITMSIAVPITPAIAVVVIRAARSIITAAMLVIFTYVSLKRPPKKILRIIAAWTSLHRFYTLSHVILVFRFFEGTIMLVVVLTYFGWEARVCFQTLNRSVQLIFCLKIVLSTPIFCCISLCLISRLVFLFFFLILPKGLKPLPAS